MAAEKRRIQEKRMKEGHVLVAAEKKRVEKVLDVPVVHTPEQIIEVPKIQVDQKAVVGKLVERKRLQVTTDLLTGRHRSAVWSTQIWWQAHGDNCCEDGTGCTDGSCEACIDAFEGSRMPSRVMDAAEAAEPEKRRKVSGEDKGKSKDKGEGKNKGEARARVRQTARARARLYC